jgi:hypothetical protein
VERVWKLVCADSLLIIQMTTEQREIVGKILSENLGMRDSSSVGTTAHCWLWSVEQYLSIFLSATTSLHLLIPST